MNPGGNEGGGHGQGRGRGGPTRGRGGPDRGRGTAAHRLFGVTYDLGRGRGGWNNPPFRPPTQTQPSQQHGNAPQRPQTQTEPSQQQSQQHGNETPRLQPGAFTSQNPQVPNTPTPQQALRPSPGPSQAATAYNQRRAASYSEAAQHGSNVSTQQASSAWTASEELRLLQHRANGDHPSTLRQSFPGRTQQEVIDRLTELMRMGAAEIKKYNDEDRKRVVLLRSQIQKLEREENEKKKQHQHQNPQPPQSQPTLPQKQQRPSQAFDQRPPTSNQPAQRTEAKWTASDDVRLLELRIAQQSALDIAKTLSGRSKQDVYDRLNELMDMTATELRQYYADDRKRIVQLRAELLELRRLQAEQEQQQQFGTARPAQSQPDLPQPPQRPSGNAGPHPQNSSQPNQQTELWSASDDLTLLQQTANGLLPFELIEIFPRRTYNELQHRLGVLMGMRSADIEKFPLDQELFVNLQVQIRGLLRQRREDAEKQQQQYANVQRQPPQQNPTQGAGQSSQTHGARTQPAKVSASPSQPAAKPIHNRVTSYTPGYSQPTWPDPSDVDMTPRALPVRPDQKQKAVVEFGSKTESHTTEYGEHLAPSIAAAARAKNKGMWTCEVTNTSASEVVRLRRGAHVAQSLAVFEGQEGYTLGNVEIGRDSILWTQFAAARTNDVGWVMVKCLKMGQKVKALTVKDPNELNPRRLKLVGQDSVLQNTVNLLCSATVAEKADLVNLGADAFAIETLNSNRDFPRRFTDAMPEAVRQVMDNGNFSFDDLWNIPAGDNWITTNNDPRAGIYLILFRGIDGAIGVSGFGFYNGKSIDLGQRYKAHGKSIGKVNAKGQMYVKTRNAAQRKMLLMCNLSRYSQDMQSHMMRLSEHTLVCLFASWVNVLTDDEVNPTFLEKYYFDRAMARAFTSLIVRVSSETGWNIPLGQGLNWKTPLTEVLRKHATWTCTVFTPNAETGPIRSYRSAPRATSKGAANSNVMMFYGGRGDKRRNGVFISIGIDVDWPDQIVFVVEIYGKGKRHPVPYAKLPEPGPFTTWGELNNIGIRVEWRDKNTGTYKTKWIQAERQCWGSLGWTQAKLNRMTPTCREAYHHASDLYVRILAIHDALLQVRYNNTSEVFDFIKTNPQIVIKEVTYQHLTQTLTIQDQQPTIRSPPRLVSVNQNIVALRKLYGSGVYFEPVAGLSGYFPNKVPSACVMCHEAKPLDSKTHAYTKVRPGKEGCPNSADKVCGPCKKLRRPCAWINLQELVRTDAANPYRFIRVPLTDRRGVLDIEGPSFNLDEMMGPTPEEDEDFANAIEAEEAADAAFTATEKVED